MKPLGYIFLAITFCVGCSTREQEMIAPDASRLGNVSIEIGVSEDGGLGFASVSEGSKVLLHSGSQGGFHVWTTPRFKGIKGTVYLERKARRVEDNLLILRASTMVIDVPEMAMDNWWHQKFSLPSFMCPPPVGVQIYDSEIEFSFELFSEDKELLATDTMRVVVQCPEGNEAEYCLRTCKD